MYIHIKVVADIMSQGFEKQFEFKPVTSILQYTRALLDYSRKLLCIMTRSSKPHILVIQKPK